MSKAADGPSGVLIVDKPQGVTSHDVVAAVRHALHTKRVGHAGTLDPMATGMLVIGVGQATKLLQYIVDHTKTYGATIRFGQRTTTDDADGEVLASEDAGASLPTLEQIRARVESAYLGAIEQTPNTFSAIKVNGKRAYDLARAGESVHLASRPVTIHAFNVIDGTRNTAPNGEAVFDVNVRVTCSAGTYIRALGRDLGEDFGCGAHLTRLRRLAVGEFRADNPHIVHAHAQTRTFTNRDGEQVTRNRAVFDDENAVRDAMLTMAQAAQLTMPTIDVTGEQADELRFGRRIPGAIGTVSAAIAGGTDVVAIVAPANSHEIKPVTVFGANTASNTEE